MPIHTPIINKVYMLTNMLREYMYELGLDFDDPIFRKIEKMEAYIKKNIEKEE